VFGAGAFRAVALGTEYRESWEALEELYAAFAPDVVVHFGFAAQSEAIRLECVARNRASPGKPDARGKHPPPLLVDGGPETLASTLPAEAILAALTDAGFPAALSDDAGDYVCNATLYRSLHVAPPTRRVGFVHVPPERRSGYDRERLVEAASIVLREATAFRSVTELAGDLVGSLHGPGDLSTNPEYMADFGKD
jgi:pyroglutamyl-peptidase